MLFTTSQVETQIEAALSRPANSDGNVAFVLGSFSAWVSPERLQNRKRRAEFIKAFCQEKPPPKQKSTLDSPPSLESRLIIASGNDPDSPKSEQLREILERIESLQDALSGYLHPSSKKSITKQLADAKEYAQFLLGIGKYRKTA